MDMSCRLFCHNQLRSTQIRIFSGTPRLTGTGEPLQVKECHLAVERPHSPNSVSKKRLDFKSIHLSPVQKNMFDSACVSNRLEGLWSLSNDPAHMRIFSPCRQHTSNVGIKRKHPSFICLSSLFSTFRNNN